ncbi:hypothetical protein HDU76_008826 [Blyttiomyces sp. JEL0837]|nr:hypothetical protein HDU76_008826 [Blyttiomyces sp. JEL0837]
MIERMYCRTIQNTVFPDYKIPTTLSQLKSLEGITFSAVGLVGPIPDWIGTSFVNLTTLILDQNYFTGGIPSSLGNLQKLRGLSLANNELNGSIPESIYGIKTLSSFDVHGNLFNGSIPNTFAQLSNLNAIYLSDNNLSGGLPDSLSNITYLQYLDFSSNNITGTVPDSWSRLDYLYELNLSGNCITGTLPKKLSQRGLTLGTQCGNAPSNSFTTTFFDTPTQTPSVTPTNINDNRQSSNGNDNTVAILSGSIVGGVLLTALIVIALVTWNRKKSGVLFYISSHQNLVLVVFFIVINNIQQPATKPGASTRVLLPNNSTIPPTNLQPGTLISRPTIQYVQPINVIYTTPVAANGEYIHSTPVAMPPGGYIHSTKPVPMPTGGYVAKPAATPVIVSTANGNTLPRAEQPQSNVGGVNASKETSVSKPVSVTNVTPAKEEVNKVVDDAVAVVSGPSTSSTPIKSVEDTFGEARGPVESWSNETVTFWAQETGLDFDIVEMLSAKKVDGKILIERASIVAMCKEVGLEDDAERRLVNAIDALKKL